MILGYLSEMKNPLKPKETNDLQCVSELLTGNPVRTHNRGPMILNTL